MDVKLSDGYFDLCINATKDNTSDLRCILLRLCQSKFPNFSSFHRLGYFLFITSVIIQKLLSLI